MSKQTLIKNKKTFNIGAYSTCLIILFLSMGYALLNETLSIEAIGIIDSPPGEKFSDIILSNEEATLNTGDGLYLYDTKYYFSGTDINNYVEFNDEIWRIVSIEEDGGIKIVKDSVVEIDKIAQYESTSPFWEKYYNNYFKEYNKNKITSEGKVPFDIRGRRPLNTSLSNSYCIITNNGCNAYDKGTFLDLIVDEESILKTYLEQVFFPNMTKTAQEQIQNYTLNIGVVETNKKIDAVLSSEQSNTTISYIGLLNISDYVYATQDTTCRNSFDKENCANSNWLTIPNYQYYILNGKKVNGNAQVWTVYTNGKLVSQDASNNFYLRPVVVLNKDITATGSGNINDKYVLGDIIK